MHDLARNKCFGKPSKSTCLARPGPEHPKSNVFIVLPKNSYAPFICSLNVNFSKAQNQLDEFPTSAESHYKCKQYIASYNCQNMLKSLSFIRSMFSSAKRSKPDMTTLSPRVRNIPNFDRQTNDQQCVAKSIHRKGKPAEMISIIKYKKDSQLVIKRWMNRRVKTPSPLPELKAIVVCLMVAKSKGMTGFNQYFQHGGIRRSSRCKIRNPFILAQFKIIDQLLRLCNASLYRRPDYVNNHRVVRDAKKRNRRS